MVTPLEVFASPRAVANKFIEILSRSLDRHKVPAQWHFTGGDLPQLDGYRNPQPNSLVRELVVELGSKGQAHLRACRVVTPAIADQKVSHRLTIAEGDEQRRFVFAVEERPAERNLEIGCGPNDWKIDLSRERLPQILLPNPTAKLFQDNLNILLSL